MYWLREKEGKVAMAGRVEPYKYSPSRNVQQEEKKRET